MGAELANDESAGRRRDAGREPGRDAGREPGRDAGGPRDPEVVVVTHGEAGSGAWRAHALALGSHLRPTARLVALVSPRLLVGGAGRHRLEELRAEAVEAFGGEDRVAFRAHGPRGWPATLSARALVTALDAWPRPSVGRVLHARGPWAALAAARAKEARPGDVAVLHDVRGAASAEAEEHGGAWAGLVRRVEATACGLADGHACVSGAMARWLRDEHGVREAEVFPCAADTRRFCPDPAAREATRRRLGVTGERVLAWSGGMAPWQRVDSLVACWHAARAAGQPVRLLVLTPDVASVAEVLAAGGLRVGALDARGLQGALGARDARGEGGAGGAMSDGAPVDAHVGRVAHDEVPRLLAGADVFAVLRDRNLVNAVASPIKVGEALACGLPLVVTRGLGDVPELIRSHRCGIVVDDPLLRSEDDRGAVAGLLAIGEGERLGMAEACRRLAVERWSWAEQVPRWRALHARLAVRAASEGGAEGVKGERR